MFHKDYLKGLNMARDLHQDYQKFVDLELKDRRLVIYYLQGGSITSAYTAIKNWEYGDLNGVYRAQRFIAETNDLLFFFQY